MLNSNLNKQSRESWDNTHLNKLYKKGPRIRIAMDPEYFNLLQEMYKPLVLMPGTQDPPSGYHQIAAAHQAIAQEKLYRYIKYHDSYIEIGPNAANFVRSAIGHFNPHGCTLRSSRDQIRHVKSAASSEVRGYRPSKFAETNIKLGGRTPLSLYEDVQALAAGVPTEAFCLNGWQNCVATAQVAISNHSLYDINFMDLALGMRNHHCLIIKAFMHFPTEILDVDEWSSAEKGYKFKRIKKDGKDQVYFNWLGDCAFGYIHDYKTWISYLTTGGFATPFGFSVVIEKTAWRGSQFELSISRTTAPGDYFYTIPNALSDLIRVPNFPAIAKTGFCKRQFDPTDPKYYIVTDGSKVRKLLDFINARAANGFTLETTKGYARTLVSEVKLGQNTAERRWNCSHREFADLCVSIHLLSVYQRRQDTEVINMAFCHLEELGDVKGFWSLMSHWLDDHIFVGPTKHRKHHHSTRAIRMVSGTTDNIYHKCVIKFFEDYDCFDTVKEAGYDTQVFFNYNCEEEPDVEPTKEDILASDNYIPAVTEPANASTPDWAASFNIPANISPGLEPLYLAEGQHDILIQEVDEGSKNQNAHKALRSVLAQAALELKKRKPDRLYLENMYAFTGVPGGAKTGTVLNKIIPTCQATGPVLVLCPTRALADKYQSELKLPSKACTTHSGLRELTRQKWSLVVIEEAFTLPIAYVNFVAQHNKTLLVGDPNQIQHVDFSGLWRGVTMLEKLLPCLPRHHINVTRRCPQDITVLPIIRQYYPGITSKSEKKNSLKFVHAGYENPQATIICFTQLQKQQIQENCGRNAFTVHECQGQTFPSVILHYNNTFAEEELVRKSPNHLIVGLTRHTNNLFIRDTSEGRLLTFINDKNPLSLIADQSGMDLAALDATKVAKPMVLEDVVTKGTPYAFVKAEIGSVELIINELYPCEAPRENIATTSTILPMGADAKGVVRLGELGEDELYQGKRHRIHRFKAGQRLMITKPHNKHLLLRSMLERLTHATKNLAPTVLKPLSTRLFNQLEPEFEWHLPENFHHRCFMDALEKMNSRGQDLTNLTEGIDWKEKYVNLIKSFLKSQQKPMLGKNPHEADKAGQGISAWDKTLNLIMSPWTRALEQVLVNQSHGKIRVMSQMSDKQVMTILEQDAQPGDKFLDNDWTQFDSNQNNLTREILRKALRRIGIPEFLLKLFMEQLKTRRVCSSTVSLEVNDKKDSGAPHTLVDNCLFNLAICMDLMEDYHHLYIKGDDSLARGENVTFNMDKMDYYVKSCGYKFKPNAAKSGQFVSFIVNAQGVALDLPRLCAKVLGRAYVNREDYDKYQEAIAGTMMPFDLAAGVNMNKINALHYHDTLRSEQRFDILSSFLFRFGRHEIPFSELYESEAIHYKTDAHGFSTHAAIPIALPTKHKAVTGATILSAISSLTKHM